jgi:hypothetical protein
MIVERKDKEFVIRISANADIEGIQRLFDYLRFREIATNSQATEEQINDLARESKRSWWEANKHRVR